MVSRACSSAYSVGPIIEHRDAGSVTFLRERFATRDGDRAGPDRRPCSRCHRQQHHGHGWGHHGGRLGQAARFLQLCDAFGFPSWSLVDCPGTWSALPLRPMRWVRRGSRMLVAGLRWRVPLVRGDLASRVWAWRTSDVRWRAARTVADRGVRCPFGRWDWRVPSAWPSQELEAIADDDDVRSGSSGHRVRQENARRLNAPSSSRSTTSSIPRIPARYRIHPCRSGTPRTRFPRPRFRRHLVAGWCRRRMLESSANYCKRIGHLRTLVGRGWLVWLEGLVPPPVGAFAGSLNRV